VKTPFRRAVLLAQKLGKSSNFDQPKGGGTQPAQRFALYAGLGAAEISRLPGRSRSVVTLISADLGHRADLDHRFVLDHQDLGRDS
jgi:hypothetical protein